MSKISNMMNFNNDKTKSEFDRRENKASKFLLSSTSSSNKINDCIRVAESFVDFAFRKHHQVVVSGRILTSHRNNRTVSHG